MNPFVATFLALVPVYGPWIIFALAVLETCFVTGIVVPSGMATSLGAVLAMDGAMGLRAVAFAAVVGGAVGDSVGFWIGRIAGERLLSGQGRFSRLLGRPSRVHRLVGRHPVYSVTLARCLAFVRTFMPVAAGMSRLGYRRFIAYDLVGVVAWAFIYLAVGVTAGESWRRVVQVLDVGGALTLVALAAATWIVLREAARRRRRKRGEEPSC